jgi:hypothetical protein
VSELGKLIAAVPDFRELTQEERGVAVERFMCSALGLYPKRYPWALRAERFAPGETRFFAPRSEWGDGPWQVEPDLVEWRHESGLPCLIVRSGTGALCGYVGLPPTHRYFAREYSEIDERSSHGGLTFAGQCGGHICHVPAPDESHHVWWIGFDCAHYGDLAPALEAQTRQLRTTYLSAGGLRAMGDVYQDVGDVRATVEDLASEMAALARPGANLSRERWWWWHLATAKQFVRQELPAMWKRIFLEQTRYGMREDEWEQAPWNRSRGGK